MKWFGKPFSTPDPQNRVIFFLITADPVRRISPEEDRKSDRNALKRGRLTSQCSEKRS
ncbi:MAG: hypothetical protein Q4G69_06680 [Planctomycetia bacterium]|nr:hypothetical protein [Planctomycetia bacterium]